VLVYRPSDALQRMVRFGHYRLERFMSSLVRIVILAGTAAAALIAQIDPSTKPPEENLPPTFHCGDRDDLPMSQKDRRCFWWTNSFNAPMLLGAAFNSALDPVFNNATSKYWGQGAEGFAKRFGTRVAQSMAKGTATGLVGMAFKEDPRFYESRKQGFWPRIGFAVTHTVIVRNDAGHERFSAGRVAGAFASGFVGMAWTPAPINRPQDALVRTGTAMGGTLAGSIWKEFQPDLSRFASGLFRKPPTAPKP
jgi:hypothetical protein